MPGRLVYVVDDDAFLRDALRSFLTLAGWEVMCFSSADEFREKSPDLKPGILLLDVRLEGLGGIQLLERWPSAAAAHAVIVITGYGDVTTAVKALRSGAMNFLEKPVPPDQLLGALEEAHRLLVTRKMETEASEKYELIRGILTPREREILDAVTSGKANKIIADDLGISIRTVEMHRANLMHKLKVRNTAELIALTISQGKV